MKNKLHIHSDNSTWSGCENMVGVMLQNEEIHKHFDVSFSFRESTEYRNGIWKWVPSKHFSTTRAISCTFWTTHLLRFTKHPWLRPLRALKYLFMIQEIIKLTKLFRRIKPDVLHINNGGYFGATSCNSAAIAGRIAGVHTITYMVNSTIRERWWEKPITKLMNKNVTNFIVASNHLRVSTKCFDNIRTIPNTILNKKPRVDKETIRKYFDIPEDGIFFLCCGVLEKRKGFIHAIRAFKTIKSTKAHLVIAGHGPEKSNLEEETNSRVHIYPNDETTNFSFDDVSMIAACDILVVPSIADEDYPNVILIANIWGKPVIGTHLAGIPEMLAPPIDQLVVPEDVSHLRAAIRTFIITDYWKNPSHARIKIYRHLSRNGKDVVIDQYLRIWGAK